MRLSELSFFPSIWALKLHPGSHESKMLKAEAENGCLETAAGQSLVSSLAPCRPCSESWQGTVAAV